VSRNGKYRANALGVQTRMFLPKPIKKAMKTDRKVWNTAIIMAIWIRVLSVLKMLVWVSLDIISVKGIIEAHRRASTINIISPLKAKGTIRLVSR
jgi:hypothetical protein